MNTRDHYLCRPVTLLHLTAGLFLLSLADWGYFTVLIWWPLCLLFLCLGLVGLKVDFGRWRVVLNVTVLVVLLLGVASRAFLIDQHKRFTYAATWTVVGVTKPGTGATPGQKIVHLIPVLHPTHVDYLHSNELADYLQRSGHETVMLEYEVVYDFFLHRGDHIERIAGRPLCPTTCTADSIEIHGGGSGYRSMPDGTLPEMERLFDYFQ